MGTKDIKVETTAKIGLPKGKAKTKPKRANTVTIHPMPERGSRAFSVKLKDLRVKNGMSQQDVADRIHTTRFAISQYERGLVMPKQGSREMLCDLFNVSQDYLFGEETYSVRLLNSWEMVLVDRYRKADTSTKRAVRAILEMPEEDEDEK